MLEWRIYYDDANTFDNLDGEPWEAPGRGVVAVVQVDQSPVMYNVGRRVYREHNWYWYHKEWGTWFGSTTAGLLDQLTSDQTNNICAIKQGRWVADKIYREIMNCAENDPDFPKKSGGSIIEGDID